MYAKEGQTQFNNSSSNNVGSECLSAAKPKSNPILKSGPQRSLTQAPDDKRQTKKVNFSENLT